MYTFDGDEGAGLPAWQPRCYERQLPDGGRLFVHGYCAADTLAWRRLARQWTGTEPPGEAPRYALDIAQVVYVCRTQPGGEQRTFRVVSGGEKQVLKHLQEHLPGRFIQALCHESDELALEGYLPPTDSGGPGDPEEAPRRLAELLEDPEFWAHLSYLSLKLYGVPLVENKQPLGEVLTMLRLDRESQARLLGAMGPLAALAGAGG